MDLVAVEITAMAITARYGTLQSGTILRTDADFAKHLVEDCGAAKYTTAEQAKTPLARAVKAPAAPRKKADKVEKPTEPPAQNDTQPLESPPVDSAAE
jgi:hypothetical protein